MFCLVLAIFLVVGVISFAWRSSAHHGRRVDSAAVERMRKINEGRGSGYGNGGM